MQTRILSALVVLSCVMGLARPAAAETFQTVLSARNEVPPEGEPPIRSAGFGVAAFESDPTETYVAYFFVSLNLTTPRILAHIHVAPPGVNGPVVVDLLPSANNPTMAATFGPLVVGAFDARALRGPLAGQTISALVDEMAAGNTYINVHTEKYPAGEIRGQLESAD